MTRKEQLTFCKKCLHRKLELNQGIICELTGQKASFEIECLDFKIDESVRIKPLNNKEGLQSSESKQKLTPEILKKHKRDRILAKAWYVSLGIYLLSYFTPYIDPSRWFELSGYEFVELMFTIIVDATKPGFLTILLFLFILFAHFGMIFLLIFGKVLNKVLWTIISILISSSALYWFVKVPIDYLKIGYYLWTLSMISLIITDFLKRKTTKANL